MLNCAYNKDDDTSILFISREMVLVTTKPHSEWGFVETKMQYNESFNIIIYLIPSVNPQLYTQSLVENPKSDFGEVGFGIIKMQQKMLDMIRHYLENKLEGKIARGVIVLDKEAEITSHDEVNRLRTIFHTRKVGHSGTLDPKVTGILVCGMGRGTKVLEYVLLGAKTYECEIEFHAPISQEAIENTLPQFRGTIEQMPPRKSSVKRERREREIYELDLLSYANDNRSARFRAKVERGTYIRTLCHDMGQALGVGAHMGELRRTQAGPFDVQTTGIYTSEQLERWCKQATWPVVGWWYLYRLIQVMLPIETLTRELPQVVIEDALTPVLASGAPLYVPGVMQADTCARGDAVCISTRGGMAVAIGIAQMSSQEMQEQTKGVAVQIDKRLMS
jgi:H/ACA ribonucleoprotein complex subunit 4